MIHKLANPSENLRNTPVDEYSESCHFINDKTEIGSVSERNHYFSKIDVSHAELSKDSSKSKLKKYIKGGKTSSKFNRTARLNNFNSEMSSVSHERFHASKDESKEIQIIGNF